MLPFLCVFGMLIYFKRRYRKPENTNTCDVTVF